MYTIKSWELNKRLICLDILIILEGKEFEDLDIVVNRMKHWAHRLYPKLPFDDVTKQITHVGKKMQIQTNLKKIRMGEDVGPYFDKDIIENEVQDNPDSDGQNPQNEEDTVCLLYTSDAADE